MTKRLHGRYLSCFIIITTVFLSVFVSSVLLLVANIKIIKAENDNLAPKEPHVSVSITNPPGNVQAVLEKYIIINGTAFDTGGSGINRVEAFVQKMPLNGTGQYKLTTPTQEGNWSRWSFPVILNDTGSYIVRARVTDNAGEQNWADVTIVLPSHIYAKKIGLIEPTFTYAAYRTGSFYDFYNKYSFKHAWYANKTITTDLNLLKNRPIPHGPFSYYAHPQFLDVPYIELIKFTRDHLQQVDPFVTNLTDVDVHEGKIFHSDGSNAYDVLFMFHNEYVTASEYNNLRQFVSNGGTLVLTEGNRLYVEISYNKTNDSITLVKGHNWEFVDGKGATPSINERWLNETKEWTGSNFFDVPSKKKVYFRNNPFNYTHTEEQHVTNPLAKILINYETTYSSKQYPKPTIATYYMDYGNGEKVIDLSVWAHTLIDNKAFVKYFDDTIIPLALGRISSLYFISLPPIVTEATRQSGAIVTYSIPSVLNNPNTQSFIDCKPTSGSFFPIGNTIVKCTAKDDKNATLRVATFTVQVEEQPNGSFFFHRGG